MEHLQEKREKLQKKYDSMFGAHCARYNKYVPKEEEYRESARKIRALYKELFDLALELGDPIPVWL